MSVFSNNLESGKTIFEVENYTTLTSESDVGGSAICETVPTGIASNVDGADGSNRPWVCNICNFAFKYRNNMLEHHRFFHLKGQVPCNYCSKVFPTSQHLRKHMQEHSLLAGRCPHCRTIISKGRPVDQECYVAHMSFCSRKPKVKTKAWVNWNNISTEQLLSWRCSKCCSMFSDTISYKKHVRLCVTEDTRSSMHSDLGNSATSHPVAHVESGIYSSADSPLQRRSNLNAVLDGKTVSLHSVEGITNLKCGDREDVADKPSAIDFVKNELSVEADKAISQNTESLIVNHNCTVMYVCKYCNKLTKAEEKYEHKANCTREKQSMDLALKFEKENVIVMWHCKYCKNNFSTKEILKLHKTNCVERKKVNIYSCVGCEMRCANKLILAKHMQHCKRLLQKTDDKEKEKMSFNRIKSKRHWVCQYCSKHYLQKRNALIHKRICQKRGRFCFAKKPVNNASAKVHFVKENGSLKLGLDAVGNGVASQVFKETPTICKWVCRYCHERFQTKRLLRVHTFYCTKHTFRHKRNQTLPQEQEKASVAFKWICSYCSTDFFSKTSLLMHEHHCTRKTSNSGDVKRDLLLKNKAEVQNHSKTSGLTEVARLKCDCGLHLSDMEAFRDHTSTCSLKKGVDSQSGIRKMQVKIKCNNCSTAFDSMLAFKNHLLQCQDSSSSIPMPKMDKDISFCARCGHYFKSNQHPCESVLTHMQSCTVVLENIFPLSFDRKCAEIESSETDFSTTDSTDVQEETMMLPPTLPLEIVLEEQSSTYQPIEEQMHVPKSMNQNVALFEPTSTSVSSLSRRFVYHLQPVSKQININRGATKSTSCPTKVISHLQPSREKGKTNFIKTHNLKSPPTIVTVSNKQKNTEILKHLLGAPQAKCKMAINLTTEKAVNAEVSQLKPVENVLRDLLIVSVPAEKMMDCDGFIVGDKNKYICHRCYRSCDSENDFFVHNSKHHQLTTPLKVYVMKYAKDTA